MVGAIKDEGEAWYGQDDRKGNGRQRWLKFGLIKGD